MTRRAMPSVFTEEGLGGYELCDVECRQCGAQCNSKMVVLYEGNAMLFCTRRPATRDMMKRRGQEA